MSSAIKYFILNRPSDWEDKGIIDNNLIENNYNTIIKIKEKYKLNNNIISNKLDIDSINERIKKVNKEIEKYL